MQYDEILNRIAPCGLSCEKCFAYQEGNIEYYSQNLKTLLGNFDVYAERFVQLLDESVFENYPAFKEMLAHFAKANCQGCRKSACQLFRGCQVRTCFREKDVDFCYQCDEFPCNYTGFDEHLEKRWIKIQDRMKKVGVETYYEESKDGSRYK